MSALWQIFRLILADQKIALMRGAALSFVVLAAGIALFGLSGWFITAAAAAGLAGMGAVFDVFRPSAMVRLLALGRTAARYGERLFTHDATLRALTSIRVRLLASTAAAPHEALVRLRGAQTLNRLMADVDALDGISLRLALPIAAGLLAQIATFAALWWLEDLSVALIVMAGFGIGAAATLLRAARMATIPSRRAEVAAQAFRSRFIDMIRSRGDLAVYGRLAQHGETLRTADGKRQRDRAILDRIERRSGLALSLLGSSVAASALGLGMALAEAGASTPALAAIGFFAALALMETVAPLRRAVSDLGRMTLAARRVGGKLAPAAAKTPAVIQTESFGGAAANLRFETLGFRRPGAARPILSGLCLQVAAGETVAVTGASGSGKSTLLLLAARLLAPTSGRVQLGSRPLEDWDERVLREAVMLVPQRSALMAGSIADALRLAAPGASDPELWQALEATALAPVIAAKGGLDFRLGAMGTGLSGGEARRLVLARGLLRRPQVLLLDEPTESLDAATALAVLSGIRAYLPQAAILTASHRPMESAWADRAVALTRATS